MQIATAVGSRSTVTPRPDEQLRRAFRTAPQSRPNVADQLERFTTRLDELTHRARLAVSVSDHEDLDALAMGFCRDLRALFRSPTPLPALRNAPLRITPEGALW